MIFSIFPNKSFIITQSKIEHIYIFLFPLKPLQTSFCCKVNTASSNSLYRYGSTFLVYVKVATILCGNIWWDYVQTRDDLVMRISGKYPHIIKHHGFEPICLYLSTLKTVKIKFRQYYGNLPGSGLYALVSYVSKFCFYYYVRKCTT